MSRRSMGRRPARDADEVDAVSRWGRRYLCYIQRPGVRSAIKRRVRRRDRHEARQAVRRGEHG
ncbi:hypothetical protein SEA_WARDA_42 [Arthrobacter phage Warda]|uniref:Uncharacterized protein n=3 Tax=Yangvirus TaxID=2733221 RepID=A0AA48Y416_9CAUD|nr:hypothetical protein PQE11_gp42 [Arthrobacter phage Warda]UIW13224.1 hypothetical protein SEA_WARDA_42 [Arthrobacter phage Warda]UIW13524.2 hypothetical protein SEA_LIZALICA_40 [Arthrobacter phage Lizalica]